MRRGVGARGVPMREGGRGKLESSFSGLTPERRMVIGYFKAITIIPCIHQPPVTCNIFTMASILLDE